MIKREDLGWMLHVALRKLCDSTPTSIAWNVIDLMPRSIWGAYLDVVWDVLEEASLEDNDGNFLEYDVDSKELIQRIKNASKEFYIESEDRRKIENCMQWTNLLTCTFSLFSESDWESYTWWLFNEE